MPTIAELQVKVDTTQMEKGVKVTNDFSTATDKLTKSLRDRKTAEDSLNQGSGVGGGSGSGGGAGGNPKPINDLSAAIDNQTKKLKALDDQRKALNNSNLKTENAEEYKRLNTVLDSRIELIRRQGNSLDQLSRQEERSRKQSEQKANQELQLQKQLAAVVASREAVVEKAAAREARQLENTLAGLSHQIRVTQEYNRTVEQLNRARATSGMNGGGMSAAEYDTYMKQAEARRRDAMAASDQTKEMERLNSKIQSVVGTFSRAEKAQVDFARGLSTLNAGLKEGQLTTEQYNQHIVKLTAVRDRAIAAANNNAAAEERLNRELRTAVTAYDPVARATDTYNQSVKILANGLQQGKISTEQFNKALTDQRVALDAVKNAQPTSLQSQASKYQEVVDRLMPLNKQLRDLADAERVLQQQQQSGLLTNQRQIEQHKLATQAIADERREVQRRIEANSKNELSQKQLNAAMRGMPAQFTDIVVSLQGGQAPLTVLLQQGGQIKDMFGGVGNALKAMGTYVMGLIGPWTTLAATIGTFSVAAHIGYMELVELNKAMVTGTSFSGASASGLQNYANILDGVVGTTGKAVDALKQLQGSGNVASEMFVQIAESAIKMERATGESMDKILDDFISLGKDPVSAAVTLDEKYRFLTSAVLAQADALVRQGDTQSAVNLLQTEMAIKAEETATKVVEQAGYMEHAWRAVKDVIAETWDAMKSVGRQDTALSVVEGIEARMQRISDDARGNEAALKRNRAYQALVKELDVAKAKLKVEQDQAAAERETEQIRRKATAASNDFQKGREAALTSVQRAQEALNKVERDWLSIQKDAAHNNRQLTQQEKELYDINKKGAEKKIKDAKEAEARANKPKTSPVDSTNIQEVKSNLGLVVSEYDAYYKRIEALRTSNQIGEEAAFYAQKAVLDKQREELKKQFDAQDAAIKAQMGKKSNTASGNISLDNQLTKSEAARTKAMEENQTKFEQLTARFQADLKKRENAAASYQASLDAQVEALRHQGDREAAAVGRGSRQGALNQRLLDNDNSLVDAQRSLDRQLTAGDIDEDQYKKRMQAAAKAHTEMSEVIVANDQKMRDSQSDWKNGMTSAFEDLQDRANDFAGTTKNMLESAFNGAGNALAQFVVTGKANFADFTRSILKSMAEIAAQQAANALLSQIIGLGMSVAGAYFGGSAGSGNGLAAGSAGYNSSNLGASQAGYSSTYFPQAKGGAWDKGAMMFANGGAFTNSVVNTPTAFNHAGGLGVMGEAGPEAIMPLSRTSDGKLGVRMAGAGGDSGVNGGVLVNVYVTPGEGSSAESDQAGARQFGEDLGRFVDARYSKLIARDLKDGGAIRSSIKFT